VVGALDVEPQPRGNEDTRQPQRLLHRTARERGRRRRREQHTALDDALREQRLDEHPAERMADHDRRRIDLGERGAHVVDVVCTRRVDDRAAAMTAEREHVTRVPTLDEPRDEVLEEAPTTVVDAVHEQQGRPAVGSVRGEVALDVGHARRGTVASRSRPFPPR